MGFWFPPLTELEIPYTSSVRGQVTLLIEYDPKEELVYGINVQSNSHYLPTLSAMDFLQLEKLLDSKLNPTSNLEGIIRRHLQDDLEEQRHPT